MNLSVTSIFSFRERNRNDPTVEVQRPIDTKVRGFVLDRIAASKGALLPSAAAPEIAAFLFPKLEFSKMEFFRKKRQTKLRRSPLMRKAPIGLMPVDPEGWVNALMQFIFFVPGFAEGFIFAPKSFFPIQEFIDQYSHDMIEGKAVSSANGATLFRLFHLKFPDYSLRQIFEALIHLLKPKWGLFQGVYEALKQARSSDIFLSLNSLKKQIFREGGQYFDLNAFIEKRPDGGGVNYIAYVKLEGSWYQCDNDRVTQIRSDMLSLSLQRGVLSHYRQVRPG